MKKTAFALAASVALLSACQKEAELAEPGNISGGGTIPGTPLLTRTVEVSGTDSTATVYSYDAAARLMNVDVSSTAGFSLNYSLRRNASGVITKTVAISPDLVAIGIDSLVTGIYYNASSSHYTYSRYDVDLGGIMYSDSTVYAYDAAGNITSATSYGKILMTPYAASSRIDYTYNSGNVATEKSYDYDAATSTWNLTETTAYTYDAKLNPLKLGAEGILMGMTASVGNNNATVQAYTDAADPTNNYTHTSTLSYNSANKPSGGTMVETPGPTSFTLRYYYN